METIFIIQLVVVLFVSAIVQLVLKKKVKRFTSPIIQASIMLTVLPIIWARGIEWQAVQVSFFNQSFLYSISAFMLGMWGLFLLLMVRKIRKKRKPHSRKTKESVVLWLLERPSIW
ncbi:MULTISPECIES: hypothetical protein [Bacillaceae]|uniref:Uncharacterized protein n=1 Tax=Alkalicoccobacillus plakortidis TaxID=444060 RepID=A0A9D5DWS1_9BACI|nr:MULTISPECIES: hypothetical protein [Bacillaceae]KQL58604.1 hypothetical protein AN965_02865 [Alkalicoccobacillus plakortidis]